MKNTEIGLQKLTDILGSKGQSIVESFREVSPAFADYVIDVAYGDLYARPTYHDKYRELAAVACLIGQGNTGVPLKAHMQGMLNVGWTKEEVIETIIFLIVYVGFPSTVDAIVTLKEILNEKPENK